MGNDGGEMGAKLDRAATPEIPLQVRASARFPMEPAPAGLAADSSDVDEWRQASDGRIEIGGPPANCEGERFDDSHEEPLKPRPCFVSG